MSATAPTTIPSATVAATATPEAPLASATPAPTDTTSAAAIAAPAPAPVGTVVYYEEQVTLPTYPFEAYQTDRVDPQYNWPYKGFDMERFRLESPTPEPRTYRLLVLENAYLKLSVLPELGGRIWQVIHKPSGAPIFYQNSVVKPTHWGNSQQLGWFALGGLEWGLPVNEHGYDWGVPWGYIPLQHSEDLASITVFTPNDGRLLTASITISLRAGAGHFEIEPTITNLSQETLAFSFWHDAMLAPGTGRTPSPALQFILPGDTMTIHSTNDGTMPTAGQPFSWPIYQEQDWSLLGTYAQYLGFFEAPAAHGPFAAVYDPQYDVGVVRSYPAAIARGSKVFTLGWQDALASSNFTDDDSFYVELHGGLAPTFDDQYQLPPQGEVAWREHWYPVVGIGTISYANEVGAIHVTRARERLTVDLYTTRPVAGDLVLLPGIVPDGVPAQQQTGQADAHEAAGADDLPILASTPFLARPDQPFQGNLQLHDTIEPPFTVQLRDSAGNAYLSYPVLPVETSE